MDSLPGAHRRRRAAVATALAIPTVALASVSLPAQAAGARVLNGEGATVGPHRPSRALSGRAFDLDHLAIPAGQAALPVSGIYALDWGQGDPYHRRWTRLVDSFLADIGSEGVSVAPAAAARRHADSELRTVTTVTRTVTVTQTDSTASPPAASSAGAGSTGSATAALSASASATLTAAAESSEVAGSPPGALASSSATGPRSAAHALPRPVVTVLPATSSLQRALKKGIGVRYSVSQEVAGYFEVLMPSRQARHLHIHANGSRWLPNSGGADTVIAYRLLVTTRKAHGRIRIAIPQRVAGRLRRLSHLTLTVRLVVHNAARRKPKLARLQSVVTLRRPRAIHAIRASHPHQG